MPVPFLATIYYEDLLGGHLLDNYKCCQNLDEYLLHLLSFQAETTKYSTLELAAFLLPLFIHSIHIVLVIVFQVISLPKTSPSEKPPTKLDSC